MAVNSNIILKILKVLTWIGFIGLCVKAGSLLCAYGISMFINPEGAKNLYLGLDLSQLKTYSNLEYSILVLCIVAIIIIQAILFFELIQIFKKINMVSPFHETIGKLIFRMSIWSLVIGVMSKLSFSFYETYISKGLILPHLLEPIILGDAFLFFAGILFFISVLYKKGIELQNENDLTI